MELDNNSTPIRIIERKNLILYGAADIMAKLMSGDSAYKIGAVYFEYKNLVDPNEEIIAPEPERDADISYYTTLADPYDYLRVPVSITPTISSSDEDSYTGNQITFFAISSGSTGVNSLEFSSDANSTVFGYGLVATPDTDNPANDIVFARTYSEQIAKVSGRQIGIQWTIRFG